MDQSQSRTEVHHKREPQKGIIVIIPFLKLASSLNSFFLRLYMRATVNSTIVQRQLTGEAVNCRFDFWLVRFSSTAFNWLRIRAQSSWIQSNLIYRQINWPRWLRNSSPMNNIEFYVSNNNLKNALRQWKFQKRNIFVNGHTVHIYITSLHLNICTMFMNEWGTVQFYNLLPKKSFKQVVGRRGGVRWRVVVGWRGAI